MRLKKEIKNMLTDRKIVQELIAGKSNRVISIEFKICHKRVARLKKLAFEYGYLDKKIELPPYPEHPFPNFLKQTTIFSENEERLLPYITWINERLNSGWHKVTVFEECKRNIHGRFT